MYTSKIKNFTHMEWYCSLLNWLIEPESLALIVSLIALFYSMYHNRKTFKLSKKQSIANSRPYLEISSKWDDDKKEIEIELTNKGVGPAIIKSFNYYYGTVRCDLPLLESKIITDISTNLGTKTGINFNYKYLLFEKNIIGTNDKRILLRIQCSKPDEYKKLKDFISIVSINIEYFDIYDNLQEPLLKSV